VIGVVVAVEGALIHHYIFVSAAVDDDAEVMASLTKSTESAIQFRNSVSSSGTGVLRLFHRIYRSP
jgi:hypothetical protein